MQILNGGFILRYAFQRKPFYMVILFCAAVGILIAPASASVTSWELSPSSPSVGDVISISGKAANNEIIEVSILHEEMVPVSGNSYKYQMNKLKVPKTIHGGENSFTVTATGKDGVTVKDMNIKAKKLIWFTKSSNASNGRASISQSNVPSWTSYLVKIDGNAVGTNETSIKNNDKKNSNNEQVKLTFKTSYEAAKANSKGDFCFKYDTDSLPAGNYTITVGGIKKEFTLNSEKKIK